MTSGADPFSILNSNPNSGLLYSSQGKKNNLPKVNRYKRGVKPVLQGEDSSESDSDDYDMFKDNKTMISKFTENSRSKSGRTDLESAFSGTGLGGGAGATRKSVVLKKNTKLRSKVIKKRKEGAGIKRAVSALVGVSKSDVKSRVNSKVLEAKGSGVGGESQLKLNAERHESEGIVQETNLLKSAKTEVVVRRRRRRTGLKNTEALQSKEETSKTAENGQKSSLEIIAENEENGPSNLQNNLRYRAKDTKNHKETLPGAKKAENQQNNTQNKNILKQGGTGTSEALSNTNTSASSAMPQFGQKIVLKKDHFGRDVEKVQKINLLSSPSPNSEASSDEEQEEGSEGDNEDSEYSSDSEDESTAKRVIKRPVFIPKTERIKHTEQLEEELAKELESQRRKHAIRKQNKQLVIEAKSLRTDEMEAAADDGFMNSDNELPNDEDDPPEEAYQKWRIRELARLKRDREKREEEFKEKENTERRRMMTDEERAKEDKKIGKYKKDEKSNYQFMQKYYHMGIFFQDSNDPIFKRDYNIGVGTDNFDKTALIGRKQIRRGQENKRGRSKHTHLGDVDTTNFDPEWVPDSEIRSGLLRRMGGYKSSRDGFGRPSRRKGK